MSHGPHMVSHGCSGITWTTHGDLEFGLTSLCMGSGVWQKWGMGGLRLLHVTLCSGEAGEEMIVSAP